MTWDDTFGAVSTDYDLYVFRNDTGALVASSFDDNVGVTGEPIERVAFTNSSAAPRPYDIFIQNFDNASAAKAFDMFVFGGSPFCDGAIFNYNTLSSGVPASAGAYRRAPSSTRVASILGVIRGDEG